ncbi:MAG: 50S ribosomal protein L25 [Chloroflexi bacterium]|nr:50S ribosomal protein L25 [Chloroflexota bacterium]
METMQVKVSRRDLVGKKVNTLRRHGIIPIHLYGGDNQPVNLQGDAKFLQKVIVQAGKNILVSLEIEGNKDQNIAFIREVQRHPVTGNLLHVDFLRIDVAEKIETDVRLVIVGEPPAVRSLHGFLFQGLHSLRIECLPTEIPESIEVNVSGLDDFEKSIRVRDLSVNPRVAVLTDPEELVAKVNPPRLAEVEAAAAPKEEEEAATEEVKEKPED